MEVDPAGFFAYELRRPNRFFRVEFDLTRRSPATAVGRRLRTALSLALAAPLAAYIALSPRHR